MQKRTLLAGLGVAATLVVASTTGAVASGLIGSSDIRDDSVRSADIHDGTVHGTDLSKGVKTKLAGYKDAYYAQAFYDVGDTNAGAIATVACTSEEDTAVSGGVQVLGLDEGANSRNTPVSSSFPGRMDWATNAPKTDRLDGWIVQFGGNAGAVSDQAPEKVKVWALCLPGIDVPVVNTFTQSS